MKLYSRIALLGAVCMLAFFSSPGMAHTALKESSPADTAVINVAPTELKLVFTAAVSLVKMEVLHLGQHAMETGFKPIAEASTEFVLPLPPLAPAAYTVNWSAIGPDGHTVSNSFAFTVDPAAVMQHGEGHQHDPAHAHDASHTGSGHEPADHVNH
ncbi:MAG: copper resistance protein CopC [Pseudohongiellaceae bacterium]